MLQNPNCEIDITEMSVYEVCLLHMRVGLRNQAHSAAENKRLREEKFLQELYAGLADARAKDISKINNAIKLLTDKKEYYTISTIARYAGVKAEEVDIIVGSQQVKTTSYFIGR